MDNQRNRQHTVHKTKTKRRKQKHNTICVWHHYTQAEKNNVNMTLATLQISGGKDEHSSLQDSCNQQFVFKNASMFSIFYLGL
jgi:hypothetical protein